MKRISTDIVIKGDKVIEQIPSIRDKALRINLNENIYGSFSEIGAGQETVRHFFRAGGSSGTIAKAMSAYDKDFSDAIYGVAVERFIGERTLVVLPLDERLGKVQDISAGALLDDDPEGEHPVFTTWWRRARAESFALE